MRSSRPEGPPRGLRAADGRVADPRGARGGGRAGRRHRRAEARPLAALPEGTETIIQPEANGTGGAMRAAIEAIAESTRSRRPLGRPPAPQRRDHRRAPRNPPLRGRRGNRHDRRARRPRPVRAHRPRLGRRRRAHRRDQAPRKRPSGDPRDRRRSTPAPTASPAPTFASALERITDDNEAGEYYLGDVLPLLREDGHKLAAYVADRPQREPRREHPRRPRGRRRRGAPQDLRAPPARRRHHHRPRLDLDRRRRRDRPGRRDRARHRPPRRHDDRRRRHRSARTRRSSTPRSARARTSSARTSTRREVGANCNVGPFTYLRPGANLADGSKAGAFVEIKNSEIGEGAKVPHLAYVGDTDIGADANLGAGSITANYDGKDKHRTKIGEGARIGVNNSLVAPVEVGEGAYTGAGAVIRSDVPPGSLGVTDAEPAQHRGLRKAQDERHRGGEVTTTETAAIASDASGEIENSIMTIADEMPSPLSSIPHDYTKSLMVFGGRASTEQAARIAGKLDLDLGRVTLKTFADGEVYCRYEESIRGADIFIVQSTAKNVAEGMTPNDSLDGAPDHDRRREGRLRAPHHRGHALVRLLAPGQEVRTARAHHRPSRRPVPRGRRRRPRPHDGPPLRPGPGLLLQAGRSHDRHAHAHAVLHRPAPRRRARDRLAGRRSREGRSQLRPQGRRPLGRHGEGAPRPPNRRHRLRRRRRTRERPPSSSTT